MEEVTLEINIFSPRWGHDDIYTFVFTKNTITISQGAKKSICSWRENRDPEWSGDNLMRIFNNDKIYPPAIFQELIKYLWESWRDGELDNKNLKRELQELEKWLNIITKSKPETDYWNKYF